MTGLLVLSTVAVLTFILILLGAPVLLAGRKVGQVKTLNSPVTREEAAHAFEAAGNLGTVTGSEGSGSKGLPRFEARIDIEVDRTAVVYKNSNVRLMSLGLLGETAIDFSRGNDHSGRAEAGQVFAGNRVPDFGEAIAKIIGIIGPVAAEATNTMKTLQGTATNLNKITGEDSPLSLALGNFKIFTEHLNELTAPESNLSKSLAHIEDLSNELTKNDNIAVTLANFRDSSEKLKNALDNLGPELKETISNTKDFTATLRAQPWRLIWPSTKKYPQGEATPIPVRKATKVRRSSR
ncbi:MAG: hypothetical protein ABIU29_00040 [Chthoniobacterales bacterium]